MIGGAFAAIGAGILKFILGVMLVTAVLVAAAGGDN